MTYAIGRGMDYDDAPAIRTIVRQSKEDDYRVSSILSEIAKSPPMRMRTAP
jgi:hypothetical protein